MAAALLDNANPTILSAEQLPTRQSKAATRQGPDTRYDALLLQRPSYLSVPFCDASDGWLRGGLSDRLCDADPIDEQEIYGTDLAACFHRLALPLGQVSLSSGLVTVLQCHWSAMPDCEYRLDGAAVHG